MDDLVRIFELVVNGTLPRTPIELINYACTLIELVAHIRDVRDKIVTNKCKRFFSRVVNIPEEDRQKFIDEHNANPKKKEEMVRIVFDMIDKAISDNQIDVIAELVISYIQGKITFEQLTCIMFAMKMLNPSAYPSLKRLAETNFVYNGRLYESEALLLAAGVASRHGNQLRVNDIGRNLYEYGIKPYYDKNSGN